jgi:hypothetical protein
MLSPVSDGREKSSVIEGLEATALKNLANNKIKILNRDQHKSYKYKK